MKSLEFGNSVCYGEIKDSQVNSDGFMSAVLFGLSQGQLDAFADAIEAGTADVEAARLDPTKRLSLSKELAGFVKQCELIPILLRIHCDSVWDLVATGAFTNHEQLKQELHGSFARGKEILDGILGLARLFQEIGGALTSLESVESARAAVGQMEAAFFAQDGESIEIDEAFAQIRGVSRDIWLQQVAARQQKK